MSGRLIDLKPKWVTFQNVADGVVFYYGLSFLNPAEKHTPCPTCGHVSGKRLAVSFWPPIDPDNWIGRGINMPSENITKGYHKRISGDTFDTLTIEPSIGFDPIWHGRITNGEVTP